MSSPAPDDPAAACPVDHKTREAWLAQARNPQQSCDSSTLDQTTAPTASSLLSHTSLATGRQVSTIPRALPALPPNATPSRPANNERDTGADASTGNWIYPSEKMFFDAMRRKQYSPEEADMKTIVPIHNAVNERAWAEIKAWEQGQGSESCGGPKLESFSGLSTSLTPRARWRSFLGYTAPFDRHDWVVDRCGTKIEYVIDFYQGKGQGVSFFLDVRPKINSWEGVRMRMARYWGL